MTAARSLVGWIRASLKRRLLAILILVLGGLSAILLPVVIEINRTHTDTEQARSAARYNALLQATLENAMLKRDLPGLQAVLDDVAGSPGIVALRVLDPAREVRFAAGHGDVGAVLDPGVIGQDGQRPAAAAFRLDDPLHGAVFRAVTPVANRAECLACHGSVAENPLNGILVVDYSLETLGTEAWRSAIWLAFAGLLVIAAATTAIGLAVGRGIVAPVAGLSHDIAALRRGAPVAPPERNGADEIGQLRRSFFDMADELRQTLGRLRASEAGLQAIIDAIPDGIRVIDRGFRIRRANAAYAAQVGLAPEQIIGRTCHALSYRRDSPCPDTLVRCPIAELGGATTSLTCRQIHQDGDSRERHVEVAAALVELDGDPEARPLVVEAIRDLDRAAQMGQEQRLAELGLFAAGLAHEINNPMNSIDLLVRAIELDLAQGDPDRIRENLATLHREIARTQRLTDAMLMLCSPPTEAQLLPLDGVTHSALALLRYQFEAAGVRLVIAIPDDLRVLVAESDLRLSVTNLALNALHAMPEGGQLTLRGWREGGRVRLEFADTGHGIPAADLARIRLPFWSRRADGSQGMGLGLPLVMAALDRAGGALEIDSQPGSGSRFTLIFPDPDARPEGAR